ncbi:hypothetical protein [Telluribacter sp.]|jgi:hypothetical protein|uniref:hypothetical protein n=1 Tax=Telluribacter sp. TaxID=1978767 RepID=UPI002E13736B|nr:hypothetical protein [Telluribacter sp.]
MKQVKLLAVLLLFCSTVFIGCKKDDVDPVEESPYVGIWKGTTNSGDSLRFTISDVQGKPMLTSYDVNVRVNYAGTQLTTNQKGTNSNGYSEVIGDKIEFKIDPVAVAGTFTSTTTLEGTYKGEVAVPAPGTIQGTFTAKKQ